MNNSPEDQPRKPASRRSSAQTVGLGVMIPAVLAASVVVGVLLGSAVDRWLGIAPWGMLIGLFLGIATGVRETLRVLRRINSENRRSEKEKKL